MIFEDIDSIYLIHSVNRNIYLLNFTLTNICIYS